MKIITLKQIKSQLNINQAIALQEEGFQLYSSGQVAVPPVAYMNMGEALGEVHIKCGSIQGDEIFVVKVAGAYPLNEEKVQGAILVFSAKTGAPLAILQDEGYLTNLRTALAGFICAKYMGPKDVQRIGVLGTGLQARLQIEWLQRQTTCRNLMVWGRNQNKVDQYIEEMTQLGFQVEQATTPSDVCKRCNLIVTTTSAKEPLIFSKDVRPGTHITAVGADAPGKQELDPHIFEIADVCVVDSKTQCLDHGEAFYLKKEQPLVELGEVISDPSLGRTHNDQITLADLTGVAVQDIQIAKSILAEEGHFN